MLKPSVRRDCTYCLVALLWLLAQTSRVAAQTQEQSEQSQPQAPAKPGNSQQDEDQIPDGITAVPNRPTFASTAEMVRLGVLEIEYGFEAAGGHQNMNGLLKFGLFKNLELWMANNPFERDAGSAGLSDSGVGFKYKVFRQKGARPTFSVFYIATLPTATQGLGTGAVGHSVQLLLSKDFGAHHIDLNAGVQFVGRGAGGFDRDYFSAFSYSHPIAGKWGWTGELSGFSRRNAATPATMVVLGAGTYNLSSRLVLDGGVYIAVYGNLPRVTGFAGFTYSIADLYHWGAKHKPAEN